MLTGRWTPALLLTLTFLLGLSLGFIMRGQMWNLTRGPEWGARGPGPNGRPPRPPEPGIGIPRPFMDEMAEEIGLTTEQEATLNDILEKNRLKIQTLRRDTLQVRMREISTQTRAEMEALLTPEQMRKFREFRRNWVNKQSRDGQRPGPGPRRPR